MSQGVSAHNQKASSSIIWSASVEKCQVEDIRSALTRARVRQVILGSGYQSAVRAALNGQRRESIVFMLRAPLGHPTGFPSPSTFL